MRHTKEPWRIFDCQDGVCGVQQAYGIGADIAHLKENFNLARPEGTALANARRIVACVNACAGIPEENLHAMQTASRSLDEWRSLIQQRDELLNIADALASFREDSAPYCEAKESLRAMEKAIAEGKA